MVALIHLYEHDLSMGFHSVGDVAQFVAGCAAFNIVWWAVFRVVKRTTGERNRAAFPSKQ
jgi:hypothetical protein